MDKKTEKTGLNKVRADRLKAAVSKDKKQDSGGCEKCSKGQTQDSPMTPIKAMLQKLSTLGLPGLTPDSSDGAPKSLMVIKVSKTGEPESGEKSPKKVLEKDSATTEEATHHTSPFVQRCVAAITKGKPSSREDESSAFAKCVSTKNKSHKDLDKSAEERPGMGSRHKEFEKSLDKVRKHHDHDN